MADRLRIFLRPTLSGIAVLLLPPLLFLPGGLTGSPPAVLILGAGLPLLGILSLLFLLASLPAIRRSFRGASDAAGALPIHRAIGEEFTVSADPPRPRFLPGVRLSSRWILRFGPFRKIIDVPLPLQGPGKAAMTMGRRGSWMISGALKASDPFGLFLLECRGPETRPLTVPPAERPLDGAASVGRPASNSETAPRLREDAEERLERRDYRPGDDIRHLDWKQLARTGEKLIRVGEDGVPVRGRVWIDVHAPGRRDRRNIRRLDAVLESADALVRLLNDAGQETVVHLPGEARWIGSVGAAESESAAAAWQNRLAAALPGPPPEADAPPSGEMFWILGHPAAPGLVDAAAGRRRSGCSVVLGFPAPPAVTTAAEALLFRGGGPTGGSGSAGPVKAFFYRRRLRYTEARAAAEGVDVRRI